MIRTSTPTQRLTVPEEQAELLNMLKALKITYKQRGNIVLEKDLNDVTIEGNVISYKLTQEETKLFTAKVTIELQVRFLTTGGDSIPSRIYRLNCEDVLNDEVMV